MLDIHGSLQLLTSSHVRDRDKGLLRSIMVGGVWNGYLLGKVRGSLFHGGFVVRLMAMDTSFGECPFPPLVEIREHAEFHDLIRMDKAHWPRCLLWHGWLPMLMLLRVLVTWLRLLLDDIRLGCLLSGVLQMSSMRVGLLSQGKRKFLLDVRDPCFCGNADGEAPILGMYLFLLLLRFVRPWCLLWHGWLPMLSGVNGVSPWAANATEGAFYLVETALGRYSSGLVCEWSLPGGFDADEVSARMPDAPKVWSDGSLILDSTTGVSAAGAGFFAH